MSEHSDLPQTSPPTAVFGERLRRQREKMNLSVGEAAERLKLPARQIEALENGDYGSLPEMVFVRGFLRTYSRFLELPEQEINEYLQLIAPKENDYQVERKTDETVFQYQRAKKPFPAWILGIAAVAAVGLAVFAWQSKSKAENEKKAADSESGIVLEETAASNIDTRNIAVVAMASDGAASTPAVQTASTPAAPTAERKAAEGELLVKTRFRSMLVVKDKSGKTLLRKIVPGGSEHRFSGAAPYQVWIGYASGSQVYYGSETLNIAQHMIDSKSASLTAGRQP